MLVFFLAFASLAFLGLGVRYLRQAMAVTATATSYIRSAAQGYVVFVGEGIPLPGHSIVAPYSGKPCLWWATQVESLTGLGQRAAEVVNSEAFNRRTSIAPFLLRDGTGECFIDPDAADVYAVTKDFWYGSTVNLSSLQELRRERKLEDDIKYVEERVELHQRIVARGYFRTVHAEPYAATHDADVFAASTPGTHVLGPPPDGRRFMLSTVPEDQMAKQLRLKAAAAMVLCALLAGCALSSAGVF